MHNRDTYTQLDFFKWQIIKIKNKYEIISLTDAIKLLDSGTLKETYICLTFDDGDISIQEYVIPLLTYLKIPASFFISTAYVVDEQKACWVNIYNYLKNRKGMSRYITDAIEENVKQLRATSDTTFYNKHIKIIEALNHLIKERIYVNLKYLEGIDDKLFHIGLHGHDHQRFSMMDSKWQEENMGKNLLILSSLKAYRPFFAIPFGRPYDWNRETINIAKHLGLIPLFANGGYNSFESWRNTGAINRIPADGRFFIFQ